MPSATVVYGEYGYFAPKLSLLSALLYVRANCFNWVVGHLVDNRNQVLTTLGRESVLPEAARYAQGSDEMDAAGETAVSFPLLLQTINEAQTAVAAALSELTSDDLAQWLDAEKRVSLGDRLAFLVWHGTYQVGQLEMLRQLTGINDTIIP
ncbi:MAG: hypothetical protein H6668_04050 [Ardenticatenaceae bacterium]|nr:hypothetical protein [Ardenticatenaceae bacterium]